MHLYRKDPHYTKYGDIREYYLNLRARRFGEDADKGILVGAHPLAYPGVMELLGLLLRQVFIHLLPKRTHINRVSNRTQDRTKRIQRMRSD